MIKYLLLLAVIVADSHASTHTAVDTSLSAVSTAYALCSDGDTLAVPAGTSTWTNQLAITKAITLRGAGIGQTIISNGYPSAAILQATSTNTVISGFTFTDTIGNFNGFVQVGGVYRVCSNKFSSVYAALLIYGTGSVGVVDHCTFTDNGNATGISITGSTNTWSSAVAYGTTNFNVIETCIFDFSGAGNGAVDAYNGAAYVFRYNMVTNTVVGHHGCDSGGYRSTYACEVYNNTFNYKLGTIDYFMQSRGGSGLYYNNTTIGAANSLLKLQDFRYPQGGMGTSTCATSLSDCVPWGEASATNPFDGAGTGGYPTLDQVGRTGPTVFSGGHSSQTLSPVYYWTNTFTVTPGFGVVTTTEAGAIQLNRDYYIDSQPVGYTALVYPHPLVTGGGAPAPTLVSIEVTPANPSVVGIGTKQFTATGTYSDASTADITTSSVWTSGDTGVATVNSSSGLATGVAAGTSTITATKSTIAGSTTLTVTAPTLVSITVSPTSASIAVAATKQFAATGTYSDSTTQNITSSATWATGNSAVATIGSSSGLATGVAAGTTSVSAVKSGVTGLSTLSVATTSIGGKTRLHGKVHLK